jgi:hypothetical protein
MLSRRLYRHSDWTPKLGGRGLERSGDEQNAGAVLIGTRPLGDRAQASQNSARIKLGQDSKRRIPRRIDPSKGVYTVGKAFEIR